MGSRAGESGPGNFCSQEAYQGDRNFAIRGQKYLTKAVSYGTGNWHVTIPFTEHDDRGDDYCAPLGAGIDERRYSAPLDSEALSQKLRVFICPDSPDENRTTN